MKKSFCFMKIVSALFALALFASCDSGGGGGGGSSGGGNSNSSGSTSISITIPSATSSSSDINLLGDFDSTEANNFYYEVYFKKGTKEIARKGGTPGKTVTFENVTYDTYDFFLDIYVDSNKITKLGTLDVRNKTVSASNNTVTFPDMSTSTYKNWYFVKNVDDLTIALSKIAEDSSYNESNKAILCLLATIEDPRADSVKNNNNKIKIIENGYSFAAQLYTVTLPSNLPEGCFVTTDSADNKFAEDVPVTLTVTAADGWFFFPPTIDGVTIPQSEENSTQFTFNMPADDVEVTTTFFDAIYVSASGTTGNDGLSEATAVDSLASAINKINYIGSELSLESFHWTIKVCGTIRGAQTVAEDQLYETASVTIVGVDNGIIDGNEAGTALTIDLTVPVTIKNLTIKNGKELSGAGIYIDNESADVTLGAGAKVTGNKCSTTAASTGGGIYVNKGKLTVDTGAEVTDNESKGVVSGQSVGSGGGIAYYINTTVIVRGKVSGNIANSSGNDIYAVGYSYGGEGTLILESGADVGDIHLRRDQAITVNDTNFNPATNITVGIDTHPDYSYAGREVLTGIAVGSVHSKFTLTTKGLFKIGSDGKLAYKASGGISISDMEAIPDAAWQTAAETKTFEQLSGKKILFKINDTDWCIFESIQKNESNRLEADNYSWDADPDNYLEAAYFFMNGDSLRVSSGVSITCSGDNLTIPSLAHIIMD